MIHMVMWQQRFHTSRGRQATCMCLYPQSPLVLFSCQRRTQHHSSRLLQLCLCSHHSFGRIGEGGGENIGEIVHHKIFILPRHTNYRLLEEACLLGSNQPKLILLSSHFLAVFIILSSYVKNLEQSLSSHLKNHDLQSS